MTVYAALDGDERRTDAFLDLVVADVGAFDAKFVGGREIVERRVSLRVRVWLEDEQEVAIRSRHSQRPHPRGEFRIFDECPMTRATAKL